MAVYYTNSKIMQCSFCIVADIKSLNVTLTIQPQVVERGETVVLICDYNLNGAMLYNVGWYYRNEEFYKYTPRYVANTYQVFIVPGIHVDVSIW